MCEILHIIYFVCLSLCVGRCCYRLLNIRISSTTLLLYDNKCAFDVCVKYSTTVYKVTLFIFTLKDKNKRFLMSSYFIYFF